MIIFLISHGNYFATPHLNHLVETVQMRDQMRDHNICFMQN